MFGWMKRQAGELWADVRAFVEGRVPGEDDPVVRDGRVFEVPDGLVPRVMRLYEDAERARAAGNGEYAGWKLWRLILDRCPETREGRWRLVFRTDGKIVVLEVAE